MKRLFFVKYGLFAYLAAIAVGSASVNDASLTFIPIVRGSFLGITATFLLLLYAQGSVSKIALAAVALAVFYYVYGFILGIDNILHFESLASLAISFLIVVVGILLLSSAHRDSVWNTVSQLFVVFSLVISLFLLFTGGITLLPTPRYNFDLLTVSGDRLSYTHGPSKFFGMSAIFSFWLYQRARFVEGRVVYFALLILFLVLSAVGAARGEIVALLAVILMMYFQSGWKGVLRAAALMVCVYVVFTILLQALPFVVEDLVVVARFSEILSGSWGVRDVLTWKSLSLLGNNPECLIHGCGYTFFQAHYGYPYELYPHNIYIESVITWGVPGLVLLLLAILGLFSRPYLGSFFWIGVFFLLIGLKSGDLIGSWLALTFLFYLGGVGVMSFASRNFRFILPRGSSHFAIRS